MGSQDQDQYFTAEGAAAYRHKYERTWILRLSNRRELSIVDRALERAEARGRILDCACGAGRLTPTLLRHAEHVICVDRAPAMIEEAREVLAPQAHAGVVSFVEASADDLPLEDGAVDTAVCHRLLHRLPDADARGAVLAELGRVASRRVIVSFSDATTRKGRRMRRRGSRSRRTAQTPAEIRAEADARGLRMIGEPLRLNGFHSLVAVAVFDVSRS